MRPIKSVCVTVACGLAFAFCAPAEDASPLDLLLPQPVRVVRGEGTVPAAALGRVVAVRGDVADAPAAVAEEAYALEIGAGGVRITSVGASGERYARVTLAQLVRLSGGAVPACSVVDWPALRWRGYMNDCGRNYLAMEGVKAILDMMAAYKMNLFHWHLSDYHGWRLESKRYPQLNRPGSQLRQIGKFYTQDEFREVVRYAAARGITVMPELDVPGHTLAFRKGMGIGSMAAPGTDRVVSELFEELCSLAPAGEMPFIHLGTDEVRTKPEHCDETWPTVWTRTINAAAKAEGRVALETWIRSPADMECGAWIDLAGINGVYGRLGMPHTPKAGEWNAFGGKVELNGAVLPPPEWRQPGMASTTPAEREQDIPYSTDLLEKPLVDEMPALRDPYPIRLKKGWNHVRISTEVKGRGERKVSFALFSGPVAHPREVPGLEYRSTPPSK